MSKCGNCDNKSDCYECCELWYNESQTRITALETELAAARAENQVLREAVEPILAAHKRLSQGPYVWCAIEDDDKQTQYVLDSLAFGKGRIHGLWLSGHEGTVIGEDPMRPDHADTLCWTGNGPCSGTNAKALHEILTRLQALKLGE